MLVAASSNSVVDHGHHLGHKTIESNKKKRPYADDHSRARGCPGLCDRTALQHDDGYAAKRSKSVAEEDCEMLEVSRLTISPQTRDVVPFEDMSDHNLGARSGAQLTTGPGFLDEMALDNASNDQSTSSVPIETRGRLVMGFVRGCEKCQNRVPGHYNHWLR